MSEHPTFAKDVLRNVLTPLVTLDKLAAQGLFVSVPLNLPHDIHHVDWTILFDGEPCSKSITEVYAPGDDTGWAVCYKPGDNNEHTGETELIHGHWQLVRGAHDFSRVSLKAKREAGEKPLVDEPSKFELTDRELEKEV